MEEKIRSTTSISKNRKKTQIQIKLVNAHRDIQNKLKATKQRIIDSGKHKICKENIDSDYDKKVINNPVNIHKIRVTS